LFSAVEARLSLSGADVLDLYAGTGALGLEAISRGAKRCTSVDHTPRCARLIASNAALLGFAEAVRVLELEVEEALRQLGQESARFDLVLLDPPYAESPLAALEQIERGAMLREDGLIVLEHSSKQAAVEAQGTLRAMLNKRYGDTSLTFYTLDHD
jgi:16S rRNA (guanine966-N2)-methyltransferase